MNAIGGDAIEMIRHGVREAERNHQALVVGNEAPNFSAGANLMLLLLEAQEGNWDEVDLMVRAFRAPRRRYAIRRCRSSSRRAAWRSAAAAMRSTGIASRRRQRPTSGWWSSAGLILPAAAQRRCWLGPWRRWSAGGRAARRAEGVRDDRICARLDQRA